MTAYKRGDVILVPFPFSDLPYSKRRPALILVDIPDREELICMMLTSTLSIDHQVDVMIEDVNSAGLPKPTVARLSRLFTLKQSLVSKRLGVLNDKEFAAIVNKLVGLLNDNHLS